VKNERRKERGLPQKLFAGATRMVAFIEANDQTRTHQQLKYTHSVYVCVCECASVRVCAASYALFAFSNLKATQH